MLKLGILGGGQLAQMMTQAAISLGVETVIFERTEDSPASRLTPHNLVGAWNDLDSIDRFAEMCDVVTLESEFVDASVLVRLENAGVPVFASADTLRLIQDKFRQKQCMQKHGIPVPDFMDVNSREDVLAAGEKFGYPFLLKARRDGYDGYGNATLKGPEDMPAAWSRLGADSGRTLLAESFVQFEKELAVMVLRGQNGDVKTYPVVETVQENHICHLVRAPARVEDSIAQKAAAIALEAVRAVQGIGIFGVELFVAADGYITFNEMAPRPHNSGHYTIEACVTSQFENHIRAVLGWPLGDVSLVRPCAVMVNTLGKRKGEARPDAAISSLKTPGAHIHLYGKRDVRPGRKMGHITLLGDHPEEIEKRALAAAEEIHF